MDKIAIVLGFAFLLAVVEIVTHKCPAIAIADHSAPGKITIHLSSGEKLHPSRAYIHPGHIQIIMPDGRAITMAWDKVDSIASK